MKASPEKSNRQIAEAVRVDHKTVASVRAKKEARGEIPHVETHTDTKGRKQQAHKTPGTTCGLPDTTPLAYGVIAEVIVGVMNPFDANGRYELIAKVRKLLDSIEENTRLHEESPKAVSPAASKAKSPQPDELPDIPEFLRRQSS